MKKSLRIGIEAQRLFRSHKHGMDIYALELIKALQAVDSYHQYFLLAQPGEDMQCVQESENLHIYTGKAASYPVWEQWQLPKLIHDLKLDVVHHTANTAPLRSHPHQIITVHDVIFMQKNPQLQGQKGNSYQHFGNMYRKWLVPHVARQSAAILTVSDYQRQEIVKHLNLPAEKVQVTYNGVSPQFFADPDTHEQHEVRHTHKLPERYFFFLGNTEPRKNLLGVLKAYSLLAKTESNIPKLVIKGLSVEYLEQKLFETGLSELLPHIHLVGYLSTQDLIRIYQMATAFLFPSFSEGFGIPIIEAMACGTPVITSITTSMPEISQKAALLVDPANPAELALAMRRICKEERIVDQLKQAGLQRAQQFSWTDTALQTLGLYEKVSQSIHSTPLHAYATT